MTTLSLTFITRIQGRGEDINNLGIENNDQRILLCGLFKFWPKQIKLAKLHNA